MTGSIVDEARDRASNPSINTPQSYREALVAVLMRTKRDLVVAAKQHDTVPMYLRLHGNPLTRDLPRASDQQRQWVAAAYVKIEDVIDELIATARAQMYAAEEDRSS